MSERPRARATQQMMNLRRHIQTTLSNLERVRWDARVVAQIWSYETLNMLCLKSSFRMRQFDPVWFDMEDGRVGYNGAEVQEDRPQSAESGSYASKVAWNS